MKRSYELVLPHVFTFEGGLSMDREDRGNWTTGIIGKGELNGTKYGISAMAFPDIDIANLTQDEAKSIYKRQYWDLSGGDELPYGLDFSVFDFAVNSGVSRAVKELQKILGFKGKDIDGIMGMITLRAVGAVSDIVGLIEEYNNKRLSFMKRLRVWERYKNGWTKRVHHVRDLSQDLTDGKIDGRISLPDLAPVAPNKADGAIKSRLVACKPEAIATGVTALSGLIASVSDAPILQYGLLVAIVIGSGVAGYYFYNRIQQEVVA